MQGVAEQGNRSGGDGHHCLDRRRQAQDRKRDEQGAQASFTGLQSAVDGRRGVVAVRRDGMPKTGEQTVVMAVLVLLTHGASVP